MAVMWPRRLPPDILANPVRSTECAVYRRLQAELDENWWVFYSRPWLGVTSTGAEIDGECDFVVAHAEFGVLCIEVKGGEVSHDPLTDQWTSRDRFRVTHKIKDPVAQARASKHQLLDRLKVDPACRGRWLRVRHGVILPHSAKPPNSLGLDRPLFLFCFAEEYSQNVGNWVLARFNTPHESQYSEEGLLPAGMQALRNLLALPVQLRTPLGHLLRDDDRQIEYLTQQQFHLLSAIEDQKRVCVQGGAGTGKTILALHLAEQLAIEKKLRTLLVCYNEALAASFSQKLKHAGEGIKVFSFHKLCYEVLKSGGVPIPQQMGAERLFESFLPEAVVGLADSPSIERYDAIVVDEGQDFRELWWLAIDTLFSQHGARLLRVFLDSNQAFYGDGTNILKTCQASSIRLSWNLRNTQAVHEAAYKHYKGRAVTCGGPTGEQPTPISVQSGDHIRSSLGQLISKLTNRESIDPDDIAVLTSSEDVSRKLAPEGFIASISITDAASRRPGSVVIDTIRRFKGLESLIVIVIADSKLADFPELSYVALSRGRTRVYVIGIEEKLERVLPRL